jgi:HlyD family secretion protein
VRRLVEKKAATQREADTLRDRIEQIDAQIRALESSRTALISPADRTSAEARLREAEAAVEQAGRRVELAIIRTPLAGTVFNVDPRPGAYLAPGTLVASVGRLDRMRVSVYVDEPELGRVAAGMPVAITWDALPGKQWNGAVEKTPAQIVPLGTRQVGEVLCLIENKDRELPPGANINASVRSRVAENALTIPKETLRREGGVEGVYLLQGDRIAWRPVKTGIANVTRRQIVDGLKAGDSVALPTERRLQDGMQVRAVPQQ